MSAGLVYLAGGVLALLLILWAWSVVSARKAGREKGRNEQAQKDRKKANGYIKEIADRLYSGDVGTNALRVHKPGKWRPRPRADE